jgi:2-methylcitrate dehydratase
MGLMNHALQTQQIAAFALGHHELDAQVREQLKRHLLDSLGSLLFSLTQETPRMLKRQIGGLGEGGSCVVPGLGAVAMDRAAQWLTALVRYPDFMDNFLGQEATCHPSDNIGGLLAAGLAARSTGAEFLDAMAAAYQIECRLTDVFPVMKNGFDHTVLLAQSQTAGMGRLLGVSRDVLANALGITGCSFLSLASGRASYTPQWKGFASSLTAFGAANSLLLAAQGLTGPANLFEGPVGYEKALKMKLDHDWFTEGFDLIRFCVLKSYNAEVHAQSAIDALLHLQRDAQFAAADVERIEAIVFHTAFDIIGGGEYGDRHEVHSKEQADHSLPYLLAVALLDGRVYPGQFAPARLQSGDVQALLRKVSVDTILPGKSPHLVREQLDPLTRRYPQAMPVRIKVDLRNGRRLEAVQHDYPGFWTRPLGWAAVERKFRDLTTEVTSANQDRVISMVRNFEDADVPALVAALAEASSPSAS